MAGRDPLGLYFSLPDAMMSTAATMLNKGQDLAKMGGLNYVRNQLAQNMATLYSGQMMVLDGLLTEITGSGIGAAGGGVGLYQAIERLGGQSTAELLELAGKNFRPNLQLLTNFSGRVGDLAFHAHHLIPQQFRAQFRLLGVNIDNPIFGQWVQDVQHVALHQGNAYNAEFEVLLRTLRATGKSGNEAVKETMDFITHTILPKYKQYGLEPPF